MRRWALLLGGMLVWTVHFFTLYAIASIFPGTMLARVLTGIVTLLCLAAAGWLLRGALRAGRAAGDEFTGWKHRIAALIAGIALVAILWQGFPALLA
ncbi:MAG: hypothetical protein ACK40O_02550 [Allosphingosinicella sp.]